jgi:hypothetical protein
MRKNLDPSLWGPGAWQFLRQCAEACDDESRHHYLRLFHLLPDILPCETCREHSREYLLESGPEHEKNLLRWLQDFETAVRLRKHNESRKKSTPRMFLLLVVVMLSLILGVCLLAKR